MSLTLSNIPRIMRTKGWNRGAALMDRWFRNGAAQVPIYSPSDNSTITMSWVLGFDKPRQLHDEIIAQQIWANDAAKRILRQRLTAWGMLDGFPHSFDQTTKAPATLENEYINFRPFGGEYSGYSGSGYSGSGYSGSGYSGSNNSSNLANQSSGTTYGGLNDLIAALGAFTFRVVVAGSVTPVLPRGHEVTIAKVGVYLRDSFDFEGFQFLGFWDDSDNSVSALNPLSGTGVYNSSFRDFRTSNGRGGDFLVFSDLKTTTLPQPHKFML